MSLKSGDPLRKSSITEWRSFSFVVSCANARVQERATNRPSGTMEAREIAISVFLVGDVKEVTLREAVRRGKRAPLHLTF